VIFGGRAVRAPPFFTFKNLDLLSQIKVCRSRPG
jgi:hypothetical protein